MTTQSKTWQRKRLALATERGELEQLYWFIEMQVPLKYRRNGLDDGYTAAAHPGAWVPVLPVAPDPIISQHWAELLCELFRADNDRAFTFAPALTDLKRLTEIGAQWYIWHDGPPAGDTICPTCGGVGECDCRAVRDSIPTVTLLAATAHRTHISRGDTHTLCGRTVQRAAWVASAERWERRRWAGLDLCRSCKELWERGRG